MARIITPIPITALIKGNHPQLDTTDRSVSSGPSHFSGKFIKGWILAPIFDNMEKLTLVSWGLLLVDSDVILEAHQG